MQQKTKVPTVGFAPIAMMNRLTGSVGPPAFHLVLPATRRVGGILGLTFVLVVFLMSGGPVVAAPQPKVQVLLLNSYHQGFRWTDELTTSIASTLSAGLPEVELHIEYMDTKRQYDEAIMAVIRQSLSLKYRVQQPDVIITSDDDAFNFIKQFHDDLFPGVSVVFCGVNSVPSALQAPKGLFAGIVETLDIKDNIGLALHLFPRTAEIVFLSDGTPTGLGTRQMAIEAEQSYPGVRFTYMNGENLATEEMLTQLMGLGEGSVVLAPAWYKDARGKVFDNIEIYSRIAAASPVPVFITSSANLGLGVFGGKVNSGAAQGHYAADLALRILRGQVIARDIPVETGSRNKYMFDSRQLTRFGIAENELPLDSVVLYRPFSFYQTYQYLVWTVVAVFGVFTAMIVALLANVQRLRETRSSLARSEENLRITLHSIGDAVITTDIGGRITRMNPVAENLTGWPFIEAAGKPLVEVLRLIDDVARKPHPNPVDKVLAVGAIVTLEKNTLLLARDGTEYRIADSGAPIRDSNGQVMGIVLVFRDITEEFARENQHNQSRKLEAIGQLAGGVAHDFNNMLGGILGSAEILGMQLGADNPQQRYIDTIIRACENAAGLTRKLLAFSRKDAMIFAPMDIHSALVNAQSLLEHSLDKSISIERSYKAGSSIVEGDSSLIENSIINLCVNAAQAMAGGGVLTLTTDNVDLDEAFCQKSPFAIEPGAYVQIGIQDTGVGMEPELLNRIFEPFFTTKGVGQGTGLGLSAVYGAIKEHRGCITVSSELGIGSLFTLYLPVAKAALSTTTGVEDSAESGSGCILVVDDEQIIRTTAAFILEQLGYQVLLAKDGQEGLELYKNQGIQIDLVILDMIMPRMGGVACFKEIRAFNPEAKVLISSGFTQEGSIDELWEAGIMGFVRKPYHRAELARIVADALRQSAPGKK
ncbi:response regulator [uncultured Desulfobulbus sp.]|uniref:hybrid sensor histidine kinase/response regulator n=1 Tax=uncultured Desulfobulbus sp. TaxID=239745 RepID=UPI0029C8ABBD|nr:response regulator [uncultured Desulfobulbus sp.]